jgi:hypothetical protein
VCVLNLCGIEQSLFVGYDVNSYKLSSSIEGGNIVLLKDTINC